MFDILKKKLFDFKEQLAQTIQQKTKEPAHTDFEKKTELKARIGTAKKLQSVFSGELVLSLKEIEPLLEKLEITLLQADVEHETARHIASQIQARVLSTKIASSQNPDRVIQEQIQATLVELLTVPGMDLLKKSNEKKPFVILLLGPNGAGKTTTLAKLAFFFLQHQKKSVWAAADTFRAASIEQLQTHADRLGCRLIKHSYGADPAAVAFDAIASAQSHQTDIVLIDSAGRQETNKNLLEELKKIVRVCKPDIKIFVAESYSGQALVQQARAFNENLGLDGFILTKLDADPKGGTLLSIIYNFKKPILFLGTGQEYADLKAFKPREIVEKMI